MIHGASIPYLRTLVLCIFMDMTKEYNKRETDAALHFEVCDIHNPSVCVECNNIYRYFKRKKDIKNFHDIYTFLSVNQKYSSLLYTDKSYFIRAFEPFVKKEINRYSFKGNGLVKNDLEQEGYALLLHLFDKSDYRTTQPARFVSYLHKTFPLLLLQAYIKMKFVQGNDSMWVSLKKLDKCMDASIDVADDNRLMHKVIGAAKRLLTETEHSVFLMHYEFKYSIQDIASSLGLDKKYIINSLYCSREKLKIHFNKDKDGN